MNDVRQVASSPQLRSRLPEAVRIKLGWLLYQGGHRLLDLAVFNSVVVDWLDRAELAARTDCRDRLWRFGRSEEYRLVDPLLPEVGPEGTTDRDRTVRLEKPFVCELEDATLFGRDAIARTEDGKLVLETTEHGDATVETGNCERNLFWNLVDGRRSSEAIRDKRVVCPLVDPWARGYFHWLTDALTKLEGIERYTEATGIEPTLVVPESLPSWMRRSLELAGYDPEECLRWDGGTRKFDRVVIPSIRRRVDAPSIDALRWLRDRMASNAEPSRTDWSSRVYISRRQARNRRVLNERELEICLKERGFETYVLEDLSVDDQIALFSGADVVFGLHGAGFTNALFASDATVIELFGSTVHSTVYYHLASGLEFQYGAIRCPSMARDVAVDPDRVVSIVDRMLE
jgi:hypothetical protein